MEEEKDVDRHSVIRVPFVDGSHNPFPGGLGPPVHPSIIATQWHFIIAGGGRGYERHDGSTGIFSPRPYIQEDSVGDGREERRFLPLHMAK